MPRHHRRRNYFINPNLQLRYAVYVFFTLLLVSAASCLYLSFGIWNLVVQEFAEHRIEDRLYMATRMADYANARSKVQEADSDRLANFREIEAFSMREKEILQQILKQNNKELTLWIITLFVFIALGTIFLTHKIAGPLYRLRMTFLRLKNGDMKQRVYLRKGDHAQHIVPELNEMISALDYSFSGVKKMNNSILDAASSDNPDIALIKDNAEKIKQELERYKTSDAYKSI